MGVEELKGIEVGERANNKASPEEVTVDDVLSELEVDDLSELSTQQLKTIQDVLTDGDGIRGISQRKEGGDRSAREQRFQTRQLAEEVGEEIFEAQLTEIEQIRSDVQLLQRIAAGLQTLNSLVGKTNSLLTDVVESNQRGTALEVKDTDFIEFERANSSRDLTSDDTISSSLVIVKAIASNSGPIYIGEEGIEVEGGYQLEPGEVRRLPVDIIDDKIQITAEDAGDQYSYISLGIQE